MIKEIKYRFLKDLLVEVVKNADWGRNVDGMEVVVPVPLSRRRENWRGFNQAEVIGEAVSQTWGVEMVKVLKRRERGKHLADIKGKEKRRKSLREVFYLKGEGLRGKKVLVVDDVYTSGATMNEAARELKKGGVAGVWGMVLAA